jgi:hypothetical protein
MDNKINIAGWFFFCQLLFPPAVWLPLAADNRAYLLIVVGG